LLISRGDGLNSDKWREGIRLSEGFCCCYNKYQEHIHAMVLNSVSNCSGISSHFYREIKT